MDVTYTLKTILLRWNMTLVNPLRNICVPDADPVLSTRDGGLDATRSASGKDVPWCTIPICSWMNFQSSPHTARSDTE